MSHGARRRAATALALTAAVLAGATAGWAAGRDGSQVATAPQAGTGAASVLERPRVQARSRRDVARMASLAGDGDVRALDTRAGRRRPCPPVDLDGRYVRGGCPAVAYDMDAELAIRTAFGAVHFGTCTATLDLTLAADGRVWLDHLRIGGTAPCNDIWQCAPRQVTDRRKGILDPPPAAAVPPWPGSIEAGEDGRFAGRVRMCVDTCVGRYAGAIAFELVGRAGSWTLRTRNAGVGKTGLRIDGSWDLDSAAFNLA